MGANQVLGLILIFVAIGAALSGEPATKTNSGLVSIAIAIIIGIIMLASKPTKPTRRPETIPEPQVPLDSTAQAAAPKMTTCPQCGKEIAPDYVACPHCGHLLKVKCPSCGRWLNPDFVACPYCGAALKEVQKK